MSKVEGRTAQPQQQAEEAAAPKRHPPGGTQEAALAGASQALSVNDASTAQFSADPPPRGTNTAPPPGHKVAPSAPRQEPSSRDTPTKAGSGAKERKKLEEMRGTEVALGGYFWLVGAKQKLFAFGNEAALARAQFLMHGGKELVKAGVKGTKVPDEALHQKKSRKDA